MVTREIHQAAHPRTSLKSEEEGGVWRKSETPIVAKKSGNADDFIAGFQDEGDARRFVEELTKRLADFDLEVAPSKTAVRRFGSAPTQNCERDGQNRPQTFNFLGLTPYVSRRRRGSFAVGRRTEGKRVRKKWKALNQRLSELRQPGGKAMQEYFRQPLEGHLRYYGVSGNYQRLEDYVHYASRTLFKWLNRRSQRRSVTWERFNEVLPALRPRIRIVHNLYGNIVFFGEAVDGFDVGLADLAEGRRGGDLEPLDPT